MIYVASVSGGKDSVALVKPASGCARWGICEAPKPDAD